MGHQGEPVQGRAPCGEAGEDPVRSRRLPSNGCERCLGAASHLHGWFIDFAWASTCDVAPCVRRIFSRLGLPLYTIARGFLCADMSATLDSVDDGIDGDSLVL